MSDQHPTIWMSYSLVRKMQRLTPRRLAGRRWECRSQRHRSHRALDRAMRCDPVIVIEISAGDTRVGVLGFEEDDGT